MCQSATAPDSALFTTAVALDLAVDYPPELESVTSTLSLCPASAFSSLYVELCAPEIEPQLAPPESQRSH